MPARGGGSWWKFLLEKPSELPAQAKLFYRSWSQGHGIAGLASIGNWIQQYGTSPRQENIPLSKIILWHPVRGESERADASAKTTERKNNMIEYLKNYKTSGKPIVLTEKIFSTIPKMGSSDAISTIKVIPLSGDTRRYLKEKLKSKKSYVRATRSTIKKLKSLINTRKAQRAHTDAQEPLSFILNAPSQIKTPRYEKNEPFFIVSSGQGRLQAIKEAVTEIGMDMSNIFVETTVYDVPRNLCSLFIVMGNEYRKDGYFLDPRHATDNIWMPAVESCRKDGTTNEDILSLHREISYGQGAKYYNEESISSNYNENEESNTNENNVRGGGKRSRKTRKH